MGTTAALTGPDLLAGVNESDLTDGKPLLGRVRDDAVMLVKRGDEIFAVGATCTHYGASLADGLVVGETVRCPMHHAAFDLRTGTPLRPPALNPIGCWRVEREDGRVRVREKLLPTIGARRTATEPRAVVIVGAGAAGNMAAETMRREGYDGELTLIGAEDAVPYDRPNVSKDYLAGTAPEEWMPLRGEDFYSEQKIELVRGRRVEAIDTASSTVALDDGRVLSWDRLLIATGAEPVRLSVRGADLPHVHTLRTIADSRRIIAAARPGTRVAIVGASFIGMEVAAALRARDLTVHVIGPEAMPFERVLGTSLGDFIRNVHSEKGVVFHLGQTVTAVDHKRVALSGGQTVDADLVVVGIGVRPAVGLAERAGLKVDRGIVVDAELATSVPGIYAAGDVARYPYGRAGAQVRIEHWVHAERMGQTAARNMLGAGERFTAVPFFWTAQYDVTLRYIGHAEAWDRIDLVGSLESRDCALAYRNGGDTLAVVTIGRDELRLEAELAFERGDEAALRALIPAVAR